MRTKRIKVYKFNELSESAKQTAIQHQRDINNEYFELDMFVEDAVKQLSTVGFNNAKLRYSLSYCQGDGLSFDADIDLEYFIKQFDPNIKKSVLNVLLNYLICTCEANKGRYSYSSRNDIIIEFDASGNYNNLFELQDKIDAFITDRYIDECSKLEAQGYAEIDHQNSNEVLIDLIQANEYEYTENGQLFNL